MRRRKAFILLVVFLLSGCASYRYKTVNEVFHQTSSTSLPYQKATWTKGAIVEKYYIHQGKTEYYYFFLRSLVRDRLEFHQLFIGYHGLDSISFWRAIDTENNELDFIEINKTIAYPGIRMSFAVTLTEDYLKSATRLGLEIKLEGKERERLIILEPGYVEGYMKKYKELTVNDSLTYFEQCNF